MIRRKSKQISLKVPGEIFLKHIQFGKPSYAGVYLCFYKPSGRPAHDNFPIAGMTVANYSDGAWGSRENILAFIGPLPVLSLDELAVNNKCEIRSFCIGTLKQAASNKWASFNHPQYILAYLKQEHRKKGNFIFELNSHKSMPIPLSRYNPETDKWDILSEDQQAQYIKTLKLLQK